MNSYRGAILCIDDEDTVLNSLERQLSKLFNNRYLIELANDKEDVLDIIADLEAEGIPLAMVISDYIMPKVKGDEILIYIHKNYPDTIKIMLTGQADIDAVKNVINRANLYRFITKPWDSRDFELTIRGAIKSFEQYATLKEQQKLLIDQAKFESIKDVINIISYEWKKPLNSISLLVDELQEVYEYKELNDKYMEELVEKVNSKIVSMSDTITEFRNFFKSNKMRSDVNVKNLILETIKINQNRLKKIDIGLDLESVNIYSYRNELLQIFTKIVNLSIENLSKQGIKEPKIHFNLYQSSDNLVIEIKDNSNGYPNEIIENIFIKNILNESSNSMEATLYMIKLVIKDSLGGDISIRQRRDESLIKLKLKIEKMCLLEAD